MGAIQLGLGVLLMDTWTLPQLEPGIEPPTFRFVGQPNFHIHTRDIKDLFTSCETDTNPFKR